eukprot:scaffold8082_cov21-Tisochrysis_lutea.AAC.5
MSLKCDNSVPKLDAHLCACITCLLVSRQKLSIASAASHARSNVQSAEVRRQAQLRQETRL